jgi:hypothetical protein
MTNKTYLLIVWLSLLAVVMCLYVTGPSTVSAASGDCHSRDVWSQDDYNRCNASRDAAAWERVWYAVVGE